MIQEAIDQDEDEISTNENNEEVEFKSFETYSKGGKKNRKAGDLKPRRS